MDGYAGLGSYWPGAGSVKHLAPCSLDLAPIHLVGGNGCGQMGEMTVVVKEVRSFILFMILFWNGQAGQLWC